jgi:DNA-binding HxlR family transcriptional regulator
MLLVEQHEGAGDPFGPDEVQCPIRELLARVGGRWSLDVLISLGAQRRHFGDLARTIPGDKVFYALTDLGIGLAVHIRALGTWSQQNRDAIYAARERYDAAAR